MALSRRRVEVDLVQRADWHRSTGREIGKRVRSVVIRGFRNLVAVAAMT